MLTVQKGNKQLNIDDSNKKKYLDDGYDVIDDSGEIKEPATGGKVMTVQEHNKIVSELKTKISELEKALSKKKKGKDDETEQGEPETAKV